MTIKSLLETAQKELSEIQNSLTGSGAVLISTADPIDGSCAISHNASLDSQFHIGSISKQITAIMLLKSLSKIEPDQKKLVEMLNDKLVNVFPDSPLLNSIEKDWVSEITFIDLLTHRSGLPDFIYVYEHELKKPDLLMKPIPPRDILRSVPFDPLKKHNYSNTNYYFLGKLLEEIEGKSYSDIFDDTIKKPLKLSNSYAPTEGTYHTLKIDKKYKNLAKNLNSSFFMNMSNAIGTGNIISTTEDLFKWNQYLFHGLEKSLQGIVFHTYCLDEEDNVHLGFTSEDTPIGRFYGMQGTQDSFKGFLGYLPDHNLSISILTNQIDECNILIKNSVEILLTPEKPKKSLKI